MKKYLVISRCEDEPRANIMTKDGLLEFLDLAGRSNYQALKKPPSDLYEFPSHSYFIWEGVNVIPKPKKVVTSWEL